VKMYGEVVVYILTFLTLSRKVVSFTLFPCYPVVKGLDMSPLHPAILAPTI